MRYQGFTARNFHEHLMRDHRFAWSCSWTKALLQSRHLLPQAPRRGAHCRKRPGWPVRRRPARTVLGACRTAGPQPHAFTDHGDAANCGPASTGSSVDAPASSRSIACSNGYMATSLNFRWCSTGRRFRRTPMAPSATSFSCHQAQGPWRHAQRRWPRRLPRMTRIATKLGVAFWDYLGDRLRIPAQPPIPHLSDLIRYRGQPASEPPQVLPLLQNRRRKLGLVYSPPNIVHAMTRPDTPVAAARP